jgi:hypothetical protein
MGGTKPHYALVNAKLLLGKDSAGGGLDAAQGFGGWQEGVSARRNFFPALAAA